MKRYNGALAGLALLGAASSAQASADDTCKFARLGDVMWLVSDCTTRATIVVPDGVTLDGLQHRITARDPEGGAFSGAVVQSGGRVAHVRNLVIDADQLAPVCHASTPVDTRVRAVLFTGASGSIVDTKIVAIRQKGYACQEGNGIELRSQSVTDPRHVEVLVRGNRIEGFQKTGLLVLGDVTVDAYLNQIEGAGLLTNLAQNGVQIGRGARGSFKWNRVSNVHYADSAAWSSVGVLVQDTGGSLELAFNTVSETDVGVWLEGVSNSALASNMVRATSQSGIVVDGSAAPAEDNEVVGNRIDAAEAGVLVYGAGAAHNTVRGNIVSSAAEAAVSVQGGAHDNVVTRNVLHPRRLLDCLR